MPLNVAAKVLNDVKVCSTDVLPICTKFLNSTHSMSEAIKSNGQCSYSQMKETYSEAINSKLKDLPQLSSQITKTIFDRQQCAGMIQVLRTFRYFKISKKFIRIISSGNDTKKRTLCFK